MDKLKILLASETYPPDVNGAANFTQRLAYGLADKGHKVTVIAPGVQFKDGMEEKNKVNIFRIKSIPLKPIHPYFRIVYKINLSKKVEKIVKSFRPQIIHIQNHFSLGKSCLREAKKLGIPIIGTNHFMPENLLEYFPKPLKEIVPGLMWHGFLKVYSQLDYITVPSYAAMKMLKNIGLKNKISVISNGIDLKLFQEIKVQDIIFSNFKLDKKLPTFLFVGRLEKDKNIDMVLKAAKIALKKKSFQLVFVGKGKDEKSFKDLSERLKLSDRVIFTGEVNNNDLPSLFNLANIYIAPGSAELQGIAVMEAMANGLPVLALNAVALPELVKDNINGFLFDFSEYDLAEKMLKILSFGQERLAEMGKNSFKLIQEHSFEETLKKFKILYNKVISDTQL